MKIFVIVFVVLVAVYRTQAFTAKQLQDGENHAKDCIRESGVNPRVVQNLRNGDFKNEEEKTQCFIKCFFEKAGFMDSNGILNEDIIIKKLSEDESETKVKGILNICKNVSATSPCERAFQIYKCYKKLNN